MARGTKATSRDGITRKLSKHADSVLLTLDTALGRESGAQKVRPSSEGRLAKSENILGTVFYYL